MVILTMIQILTLTNLGAAALTAEPNTILTTILTAVAGSLATLVPAYFKYRKEVEKSKVTALATLREEAKDKEDRRVEEANKTRKLREQNFDAQLKRQEASHKEMMKAQQKAFQEQLDLVRKDKAELLNKINTLEETVDQKIEQIIDLATQNSRREGMLEVMKNGKSES